MQMVDLFPHCFGLTSFVCRYGNSVSQPAATDLVVKVPGALHDQGSCVFDTVEETIVQFTPQEAGEPQMSAEITQLGKRSHLA